MKILKSNYDKKERGEEKQKYSPPCTFPDRLQLLPPFFPTPGKARSLGSLSTLGSFAEAQERTASLSKAGLCLKALTVLGTKRRLHSRRAKPEGAMWSQLPASTTWSTTQHPWLSKAGVWKRLERLSILLASHWLIVPLVNLLVEIQRGKAGSCIKAWTICLWKLLHLFRIQGTDWRIQT